MRLLIISHTPHYNVVDKVVAWGPTAREIDALSALFEEVVHIAPLHDGPAPESSLEYKSENVRLVPVPASGGTNILAKLRALLCVPVYARTILRECKRADAAHVRCPAGISMVAIVLLRLVNRPPIRWVKYAGNWRPGGPESLSYTFQRWWLRHQLHRGTVTVNGEWSNQPEHILSFPNPSLDEEDLSYGRQAAEHKNLAGEIRLLFVGRVEEEKGAWRAVRILAILRSRGMSVRLDIIGDGPLRNEYARRAAESGLSGLVAFHGWRPRGLLGASYANAHFLLLPSESSEGWPKVLSEAMAYGVVPLAGAVSSIPQILSHAGVGRSIPAGDVESFAETVEWYVRRPEQWELESRAGIQAATAFTYSSFLQKVDEMFRVKWGSGLLRPMNDMEPLPSTCPPG